MSDISDVVSQTVTIVEVAGRPAYWLATGPGGNVTVNPGSGKNPVTNGRVLGASWADPTNDFGVYGVQQNLHTAVGPCVINCNNNNEAFSFHSGGCNFLMGDGHVVFARESMSPVVITILTTQNGGEVTPADY